MPAKLTVRKARAGDLTALVDFNVRMALETEARQLDPGAVTRGVAAVLKDPQHGFYLVAESGATVVGSLMVTTEWSDWRNGEFWWIQSVYVVPGFRRRGVFKDLYAAVRKRAGKSAGVCGFRLYVERDNTGAQAAYARLGMAETAYKVFEELCP